MARRYRVERQPEIPQGVKDYEVYSEDGGRVWFIVSSADGVNRWIEIARKWEMPEPMLQSAKPDAVEYWREVYAEWQPGDDVNLVEEGGVWYWEVDNDEEQIYNLQQGESDMPKDKLSETQLRVLRKLAASDDWMTAYDLQCSLSTLYSLSSRRNYVARDAMRPGDIFTPHTNIHWQITTVGKEYLAQVDAAQ